MPFRCAAGVAILIAISSTDVRAQGACRERAFGGVGWASISGLSDNRVQVIVPSQTAKSPTIFVEGTARIACRVGIGFETMSLGTVSAFDHFAPTLAFSQTESERLWLITGRIRLVGTRFVAIDGVGGIGALHQTLETTNISYVQGIPQVSSERDVKAGTPSFAYGVEGALTPVRHVQLVVGMRGVRLAREIPVTPTSGDIHFTATFSARAAW